MITTANSEISRKKLVSESDWLASTPCFYDLKAGVVSSKIQKITSNLKSPKIHLEGLYNYLDFGYSVFEQTPIEDVRFLRHSSRIWREESGALAVEHLPDPFDQYAGRKITEFDVIELIRERVQTWEASLPADQEIVLPLSGGFDSRLLLWCLRDPKRVRAYTYGISENQDRSTEVVHAQALASHFGIRWERIPLGDFHSYFDSWDAEFGLSTHAHGMYHFEFYTKIRERLKGRHAFLSGIIGDVWAGSIPPRVINNPAELIKLGYTHGLHADPTNARLGSKHQLRDNFWVEHCERLTDSRFQVVSSMRFKLIMLSYLMRVPRLFDFEPWTPFLDIDVAMAMLNLPPERRANRQWQRDFFAKVGLDLESQGLKSSRGNSLDFQGLKQVSVRALDVERLSDYFDRNYIEWINREVSLTPYKEIRNKCLGIPKIGGALRRIGLKDKAMEAYNAYVCLRPIDNYLRGI